MKNRACLEKASMAPVKVNIYQVVDQYSYIPELNVLFAFILKRKTTVEENR